MVDLATFRPESPEAFLDGILEEVVGILGAKYARFEAEMADHVRDLGKATLVTAKLLADETYTERDAGLALRAQELYLGSILMRAEFLAIEAAQTVLEAVSKVARAVIRNYTGIDLRR